MLLRCCKMLRRIPPECRLSYGRGYRQIYTSTLCRCFVILFTGCQSLRGYSSKLLLWPSTVSEVLVLSTSSKSSAQSRTCHVGHSVRLAAATCSFRGQTRPSASEVSPSRLLLSGTHFHQTSAHRTTVANSSDLSWKPIFSDKHIALHDSSENIVEECNCNCNCR